MNVLVVGGSGFVGTNLCRELVERGHDVTALSRSPDDADLPSGVETVMGDVTAYDSIEGAFEGQDAVVYLVALSPLFKPNGGNERHFEVHLGGTENCVQAAEEHGVELFVQMSGIHASPDADTAYLQSKGEAEAVVKESKLDWVIFRPTVLFGEGDEIRSFTKLVATPYLTPLPGGGKQQFQLMWVEDCTGLMADALEGQTGVADVDEDTNADADAEPAETAGDGGAEDTSENPHVGQVYEVGGPEVQPFSEVVELTWAAENKPVSIVPVPMGLADVGLSVLGSVGGPLGADQARSLRKDLVVEHNDIDAFGVSPEELTAYAEFLGVERAELEH
jgi:NADH dehydrogenase